MTTPPVTELSSRARDVFKLVVEAYLGSGAPVGSRTLSKLAGLSLSPASIRNVMQDLEELGLLTSPHVSAGRVPTEIGLRLFVDGMMQTMEPTEQEMSTIKARLSASGPIEDALAEASSVLSGLSACAGLVMVQRREAVLRQFAFTPLSDTQALAILVGEDGTVENRIVDLPPGTTASMLVESANYVTRKLAGLTLPAARERLERDIKAGWQELDSAARELIAKGLAVWSEDGTARPVLIVRGQANLIEDEAADLERVRQLLDELEDKESISRLLHGAVEGASTKIFIGSENKLFSLSGSSVIAAPYRNGGGRVIGVVGVIGPTRLNYARIVPMVDFTAQTLTRLMT